MWCLHRLLAIDDDLESDDFSESTITDHLAACLLAILLGRQTERMVTARELLREFGTLSPLLSASEENVSLQTKIVARSETLINDFSTNKYHAPLHILHSMVQKYPTSSAFRTRLCSAFLIGLHYQRILGYLHSLKIPNDDISWHNNFFWKNILAAGSGQILSRKQRNLSDISLALYIDLAIGKSNAYMNLVYSYRYLPIEAAFREKFISSFQFLQQIYLDDVVDLKDDVVHGILNYFPIFLLEQGRVAGVIGEKLGNTHHALIEKSPIASERYHGIFIQQSPYFTFHTCCSDPETKLRCLLANRKSEVSTPLSELVVRRRSQARAFEKSWLSGRRDTAYRILHESSVVERNMRGFQQFLRQNARKDDLGERTLLPAFVWVARASVWAEKMRTRWWECNVNSAGDCYAS